VLNLRPDINIIPVRGNVDTRLRLPGNGEVDGVILAAAGLIRLNRSKDISAYIPVKESIPDIGQGALLLQCRDDDTFPLLKSATDIKTQIAVCAERAFLFAIHGECSSPVAAYAKISGDEIIVKAMAGTADGKEIYRTEVKGSIRQPVEAGLNAVQSLLDSGAADLIGAKL
jgi:hydroxymethylbilane synthase